MTPLFKKLNLGEHRLLHVLNAPASFEPALAALQGLEIRRCCDGPVGFGLAFAITQREADNGAAQLMAAAEDDAVLWLAYPKASSKRYRCEFNRDCGWPAWGAAGYEPVRQVAIDEDWSALRFRQAQHIQQMRRNPLGAISKQGREKASRRA